MSITVWVTNLHTLCPFPQGHPHSSRPNFLVFYFSVLFLPDPWPAHQNIPSTHECVFILTSDPCSLHTKGVRGAPLWALSVGTVFPHHCFQAPPPPRVIKPLPVFNLHPHTKLTCQIEHIQALLTSSAGYVSPPQSRGIIWGRGAGTPWWVAWGAGLPAHAVTVYLLALLSLSPDVRFWSYFGMLGLPESMTLWVRRNPAHNGQFQMRGYLVSYNQEFCLY